MSTSHNKSWFWLLLLFAGGVYFASDRPGVHPPATPSIVRPATPHISVEVPEHQPYSGVISQLQKWHAEAPDLTEFGNYGTSKAGNTLHFLRVTNLKSSEPRPEILIHSCIHANEPIASDTTMGYIGRLLSRYGVDQKITSLLDTRDIYFIPVLCPDNYPNTRYQEGRDPNRDFPGPHDPNHKSTTQIAAIQYFYKQHSFRAAWSGHSFGRQFLYPYGDSDDPSPDDAAFKKLFGEMGSLARYDPKPAHALYGHVIHGSEVDFYYRTNRAVSCVVEMGTHQRPPTHEEIKSELARTFEAFLLFLDKAPLLLPSSHHAWLLSPYTTPQLWPLHRLWPTAS